MDTKMIIKIFLFFFMLPPIALHADERNSTDVAPSFLDKLFGKKTDFTDLKKKRRELVASISKIERDIKTLESQAEQLSAKLEDASSELNRLNKSIRTIDAALASTEKTGKNTNPSIKPQPNRYLSETDFLESLSPSDQRSWKAKFEQEIRSINDNQARLTTIQIEIRKKSDELDIKKSELIELEDRIGVELSVGQNQYIYRTVVSLIFAAIVALLVFQFFGVIKENEEIRKSIFTGDTGIQFITLFSIVIAVILFGILEILGANELSALLGGLSGYILGKSSPRT